LSQFVLCAREGRRTNCANSCFPGYQRVRLTPSAQRRKV